MENELNTISEQLFHKQHADEAGAEEISSLVTKYPYFGVARFFLAKKLFNQQDSSAADELVTTSLYFHNPLRLDWLLNHSGEQDVAAPAAQQKQETSSTDESPIAFQSYHTVDYFASQGIRLQQADLTKDKLGQQLKSFTEWLRSMKKLPSAEADHPSGSEDRDRQQHVIETAAHSIEEKQVYTEAMAEVWAKQGNAHKAIEIYDKLSLLNPAKSGYFAAKIEQLKGA